MENMKNVLDDGKLRFVYHSQGRKVKLSGMYDLSIVVLFGAFIIFIIDKGRQKRYR